MSNIALYVFNAEPYRLLLCSTYVIYLMVYAIVRVMPVNANSSRYCNAVITSLQATSLAALNMRSSIMIRKSTVQYFGRHQLVRMATRATHTVLGASVVNHVMFSGLWITDFVLTSNLLSGPD